MKGLRMSMNHGQSRTGIASARRFGGMAAAVAVACGVMSAWAQDVSAPTAGDLSILAEGDLVEDVAIRLGSVPEGWTLHYTTDGSEPTVASSAYTGPFMLAQSATVKAVAVNDETGWATDVAEQRFDLAPPLALTGARVRQRYPWNGLVDIDFTLAGDTSKCYRVSAVATDRGGGTNLTVRKVWEVGGGVTNSVLDVAPGSHRFVWDAAADLPAGFIAERVAVSLRAEALHDTALYMVVDLSGGPDAERYPISYLLDVPEGGWTDEYKTDKLVLRRIEPGNAETCGEPMFAAVFETTQAQFENIMNSNPSAELGAIRPVHVISYDDIRGAVLGSMWPVSNSVDESTFMGCFRKRTGRLFDLPTDRMWMYACQAGTVSKYNNGGSDESDMKQVGRYSGNLSDGVGGFSGAHTAVGSYRPNAWNIYDMHGNVQERCLDWYGSDSEMAQYQNGPTSGPGRVVRGGGFGATASECRSSGRGYNKESLQGLTSGFRLFLHDAPAVVEAPIVAPQGLTATSDRADDVSLSWQPVVGAYAYQIRRSKTTDFADGTWLNTVTNTTYADWTAEVGTNYTYWVRAQFESGKVGCWSEAAAGSRYKGYTVHFNSNGGAGTMADLELRFDEPQALTDCGFSKSGSVFAGWATASGGQAVYANGETVENLTLEPGAIVTLYACWATASYTVKFDKNSLTATGTMSNQTMTRNASAALRANSFVRVGYKFSGWATSASGAKVYNDKQAVQNLTSGSTITLYAVWEALTAQNALYMVIDLSGGVNASSYPVSYLSAMPSGGWTDTYKMTKLVLRRIEPGTFTMGSPASESGRQSNETQHKVTLTKAFYIGVFEVTQKQYKLMTGLDPSSYKGDKRPVEKVTYLKLRGNQNWPGNSTVTSESVIGSLRTRTGYVHLDLPTEAQWEYACRAGTTTPFANGTSNADGLKKIGRFSSNTGDNKGGYSQHTTVGSYVPNSWGLYDMHGNVFEWCLDYWNAAGYGTDAITDPKGPTSYVNSGAGTVPRIRRGGYYDGSSASCRSARRHYGSTADNYTETVYLCGFRLCITME